MDYNQVFVKALEKVMEEYKLERIRFYSERDLQAHLFSECLGFMRKEGFQIPFEIYADKKLSHKYLLSSMSMQLRCMNPSRFSM